MYKLPMLFEEEKAYKVCTSYVVLYKIRVSLTFCNINVFYDSVFKNKWVVSSSYFIYANIRLFFNIFVYECFLC